MAQRPWQDSLIDALTSIGQLVVDGVRGVAAWLRARVFTDANLAWARALTIDIALSPLGAIKVARPSVKGAIDLFGDEIVGTAVGWTAGLLGAGLVGTMFQARGARNLWGLIGRKDTWFVSQGTFDLMVGVVSFGVGLVTLIVVRHFARHSVAEFHRRRERRRGESSVVSSQSSVAVASGPLPTESGEGGPEDAATEN